MRGVTSGAIAIISCNVALACQVSESESLLQMQAIVDSSSAINSAYLNEMIVERKQASRQYQNVELRQDVHPAIKELTSPETGDYSFQPVRTDSGALTNIILVRAPIFGRARERFHKYKDEVLFIGISSLEDFPLPPPNPFSTKYPADEFVGMFPGFLNMYRNPESLYPAGVKTIDLSQSDFSLPDVKVRRSTLTTRCIEASFCEVDADVKRAWYGKPGNEWTNKKGVDVTSKVRELQKDSTSIWAGNNHFGDPTSQDQKVLVIEFANLPKEREIKYDFIMSGSNQDVDNDCVGWSSYAKNWTFAKQAFDVMCQEGLKGVIIAARKGDRACSLPKSCDGLVEETLFMDQNQFFDHLKQSRFLFLPQVHDASPRVATQGLAHNLPLLMNYNIIGGWKYLNNKTGEFFHDISDFRGSLKRLLGNIKSGSYAPRDYVQKVAGDELAGAKFKKFIEDNFGDRVKLPPGTRLLFPTGA